MLEALVVTLREGIEAALVVAIIVAFLRRQGRERFLAVVWAGIAAAVVASLAGAALLERVAISEEVFEGVLYTASAAIVASMTVWMWRHSSGLAGQMKGSLGRILERRRAWSVAAGLFAFTFLMVFREGVETVLFLSALSLATRTIFAWLGAGLGIAAAVAFGYFFVRGSLRIDLGRFFKITGITLLIFTAQLAMNGYHELSEAGWVPANETTMGLIGPLVRNEFFFVAAVVLLPLLLLVVPASAPQREARRAATSPEPRGRAPRPACGGRRRPAGGAPAGGGHPGRRGPRRPRPGLRPRAAALTLSPATPVTLAADGDVHLPLTLFADGKLHRFTLATLGGIAVRFIAIGLGDGKVVTGFDACRMCGPRATPKTGRPSSVSTVTRRSTRRRSASRAAEPTATPLPGGGRRAGDRRADIQAGASVFAEGHPHHHAA